MASSSISRAGNGCGSDLVLALVIVMNFRALQEDDMGSHQEVELLTRTAPQQGGIL